MHKTFQQFGPLTFRDIDKIQKCKIWKAHVSRQTNNEDCSEIVSKVQLLGKEKKTLFGKAFEEWEKADSVEEN